VRCIQQALRARLKQPSGLVYLTEALRRTLSYRRPELEPLDLHYPQEVGRFLAEFFFANRKKIFPNWVMNLYDVGSTDLAEHLGYSVFSAYDADNAFRSLVVFTLAEMDEPRKQKRMINRLMSSYYTRVKQIFPPSCLFLR
jgi:hypothetical protein